MSRRSIAVVLMAVAVLFAACSSDAEEETLRVSAAASLGAAFTDIAAAFGEANSNVAVELNLGGSSALREQIIGGAPVDVFASADERAMGEVADAGLLDGEAKIFAMNAMTIAVPIGNPGNVSSLEDFANPDLFIGLCAVPVPCGIYGLEVLDNAGVTPSVDSEEPDVASLANKIENGDLDAGIVYLTDFYSRRDVIDQVLIDDRHNVVALYPIAALKTESKYAKAFVDFVFSAEGQEILESYGFRTP